MAGKTNPLVAEAIRLVDDEGLSIYEAANRVGAKQSSVYAAFQRRKVKVLMARAEGKCEKCGAPVNAAGEYVTK
jgi:predicted DNA-binding protein (UPF0251 family)